MLGKLPADEQARLVAAMDDDRDAARRRHAEPQARATSCARRKPGDFGWIVTRHAELYAQEYGWTEPFEGLCAQIVADFANNFDAEARALLDRRDERRERRLRHAGEGLQPGVARSACCWSIRRRAGSGSASGWSTNASSSRARPATRRSRCGRTASSPPPATSTRRPASRSPPARRNDSWGKDVVAEYWDLDL